MDMKDAWQAVAKIREFNRFYTVVSGFLDRTYLDSEYSVTETRILFELLQRKQLRANQLIDMLQLDKGYISRLIRNFERSGVVTRTAAPDDRRTLVIELTKKGQEVAGRLVAMTNGAIGRRIERLSPEDCDDLCRSMQRIIEILSDDTDEQEQKQ